MSYTTQKIIDKFTTIHGDKFDYSKVIFTGTDNKVIISCKKHECEYSQNIYSHMRGTGCRLCGKEIAANKRKSSLIDFIKKSSKIHKNKYTYNNVDYINSYTHVLITCLKHGDFSQKPNGHLSGDGCSSCHRERQSVSQQSNTEEFIEKSKKIFGDNYLYEKTIYTNSNSIVIITCLKHGDFVKKANTHLNGAGCRECKKEKLSQLMCKTNEQFIKEAKIIHKNKYKYEFCCYKNALEKIIITCEKHGNFMQSPNSHLNGGGCKNCSKIISNPETEWLDILNIKNRQHYIYLHPTDKRKRFSADGFDSAQNIIYEFHGTRHHGHPDFNNPNELHPLFKKTYEQLYIDTIKREKVLKSMGYKLVIIWEHDFKKLKKFLKIDQSS